MSHMADFARAINLIRKYEGFNESAYANFETGEEPYTIGYGTQFYPDGNPVRKGQKCTKSKALEYLIFELQVIEEQLDVALPNLNPSMKEALLSFIHSIGWDSFLYSEIIDHIDQGEIDEASKILHKWIFDAHRHAVGTLVQRRRDECKLFLDESADSPHTATDRDWETSSISP